MTRYLVTADDPGPAARTAKNAPTVPGLTNQPHDRSERNPMVGTDSATHDYSAVVAVLRCKPTLTLSDPSDKANWLFELAEALDITDLTDEAEQARTAATDIVRAAIESVAGGALRPPAAL
jgi:hypothetical protein